MMFLRTGKIVSDQIILPVKIFPKSTFPTIPEDITNFINKNGKVYKAILDTGATKTCIEQRISKDLNLSPLPSKIQTQTANGLRDSSLFPVQIVLFSAQDKYWSTRNLIISDFDSDFTDVLLGMDIISQCHLTITPDSYYCLSF